MSDSVEALVVGSGFGGAICAAQLVGAGVRTVMLERGPWRDTLPVRRTGKVENMAPLPRGKHFYTHLVRNVQAHFSGRLRTPDMRLNRNGFYELFYDQRPMCFSQRVATTVHPLGGAPISDDPGKGLVDGAGQLHEHPGLYVADATALPRSPGMPPFMAIAAWSYHVAEAFLMANGYQAERSHPAPFSQPKVFTL